MNRSEELVIEKLSNELRIELLSNIIPYWLEHTIDHENGGFYGQIDHSNVKIIDADKGSVLMSRILWTFSACYKEFGTDVYRVAANHAFDFLKNKCWDPKEGGVYWMVQFDGSPKDQRKLTYAQSFSIYALSEYYGATGNREALEMAMDLYGTLEEKCADETHGGYHEVFDQSWNKLEDARLSDEDKNEPRSTNTHLHIMEAYSNLYRYWHTEELCARIKALVDLFVDQIISEDQTFTIPFLSETWTPKSSEISYGHDIETSWLLHEAAVLVHAPKKLDTVERICVKMVDYVQENGLDSDGGIFNEGDENGVTDERKDWWPQAEGIVGFFNAYQISSNTDFLESSERVWEFVKVFIIDKEKGEWHEKVGRNGKPYKLDKVRSWKCPYHNARAALEIIQRADSLLKNQRVC